MGKPYWGYNNLLTQSDTALSARTESTTFPVSNLGKHRLWPGYRSADKALRLNGTDEKATITIAQHGGALDLGYGGGSGEDFCIWGIIRPNSLTGSQPILGNFHVAATLHKGWQLLSQGAKLKLQLGNGTATSVYSETTNNVLTVGQYTIFNVFFDSAAQTVTWYIDHLSAPSTTQGTIPSVIVQSAIEVSLGYSANWSKYYDGDIVAIGVAKGANAIDHGAYLNPTSATAYYKFDDNAANPTDSSGNGYTLTGVGIDSTNYKNCTAYHWVRFSPAENQNPTYLFIDRRHNLTSNAIVSVHRANVYAVYILAGYNDSIVAGQPVIIDVSSVSTKPYWIEVHDPGNIDGYIELPYVFLGTKATMGRAHLKGYNHAEPTMVSVVPDSGGGYTGYAHSEKLWSANTRFRCNSSDFSTLQSVLDTARLMRPVVFSEDGTDAKTRLVYLPEAMKAEYQHIITNQNFVDIAMQEAGGGA